MSHNLFLLVRLSSAKVQVVDSHEEKNPTKAEILSLVPIYTLDGRATECAFFRNKIERDADGGRRTIINMHR